MKLLSGASLFLALAMTACAAAADDECKQNPFYPTPVGATWSYKAGDSKFTLKVTGCQKLGTRWCAHVETIQDGKTVGSEDVSVQDDGVYRVRVDDQPVEPAVLILKLPPPANESWPIDATATSPKGDKQTLKGRLTETKDEKVTAGGVDYTTTAVVACEDLEANGAKYSFKTYYAKDVGMVKQEISAGGLKIVVELEKYEAAPK